MIVETPEKTVAGERRETESSQHDAKDLDAQIRAANAAEKQIFPSWLAAILSAAGTALIVWTLCLTRKQLRISEEDRQSARREAANLALETASALAQARRSADAAMEANALAFTLAQQAFAIAQKSADAAAASAVQTKRSVDTYIAFEKPYLSFSIASVHLPQIGIAYGGERIHPDMSGEVTVVVESFGRTPAKIEEGVFGVRLMPYGDVVQRLAKIAGMDSHLLKPTERFNATIAIKEEFSPLRIQQMSEGQAGLNIIARFRYIDPTGELTETVLWLLYDFQRRRFMPVNRTLIIPEQP